MKFYVWSFLILLVISSCTVKQTYEFNEDFSGDYGISIDMSSMLALMEGETETGFMKDINADSLIDALNAEPGISNAFIGEKDGVVNMGFAFEELANLNDAQAGAFNEQIDVKESEEPAFVVNGKKLTYNPPSFNTDELADMEGTEGMTEMMRYEVVMRFAKPIKKIDNEEWEISDDNKSITLSVSMAELQQGKNGAFTLKFK